MKEFFEADGVAMVKVTLPGGYGGANTVIRKATEEDLAEREAAKAPKKGKADE